MNYIRLVYDKADNEFIANEHEGPGGGQSGTIDPHFQAFGPAAIYSTGEGPFSPFGGAYELTTKDGTTYEIDAGSGQIKSITNPNGSAIDYTVNADGSFTAVQAGTQNVLFSDKTDNLGRITSIGVPGQIPIVYAYSHFDPVSQLGGDLRSVQTPMGDKTYYAYQDWMHPHYLTGITNAMGQTVLQAQYDGSGQLSAIINAQGTTIPVASFDWGAGAVGDRGGCCWGYQPEYL